MILHKPLMFISHASEDGALAHRLQHLIAQMFQDYFDIFYSSSVVSIHAGAKWREEIRKQLEESICVLVLLTSTSIERNWVMYEAGACWFATEKKNKLLIPCLYNLGDIPSVFGDVQAVNLRDVDGIRRLIETLKVYLPFTPRNAEIEELIDAYIAEDRMYITNAETSSPTQQTDIDTALETLARYYRKNAKAVEGSAIAQYLKDHKVISQRQQTKFNKSLIARINEDE